MATAVTLNFKVSVGTAAALPYLFYSLFESCEQGRKATSFNSGAIL